MAGKQTEPINLADVQEQVAAMLANAKAVVADAKAMEGVKNLAAWLNED